MGFGLHLNADRLPFSTGRVTDTRLQDHLYGVKAPREMIVELGPRNRTYLLFCSVCQKIIKKIPLGEVEDTDKLSEAFLLIIRKHAYFRKS